MIVQHSATATLFDPIRLGPYVLPHRVFMAPLTRGRADLDGTPTDIMAVYYQPVVKVEVIRDRHNRSVVLH